MKMGFRRKPSDQHIRLKSWRIWIDSYCSKLSSIGLPPEVYLDESHWEDFLENGHLHWHESSGFEFAQLSPEQMIALHIFLELEYGDATPVPPLLNWVRVRCGPQ
jgi:hypothetical protein